MQYIRKKMISFIAKKWKNNVRSVNAGAVARVGQGLALAIQVRTIWVGRPH